MTEDQLPPKRPAAEDGGSLSPEAKARFFDRFQEVWSTREQRESRLRSRLLRRFRLRMLKEFGVFAFILGVQVAVFGEYPWPYCVLFGAVGTAAFLPTMFWSSRVARVGAYIVGYLCLAELLAALTVLTGRGNADLADPVRAFVGLVSSAITCICLFRIALSYSALPGRIAYRVSRSIDKIVGPWPTDVTSSAPAGDDLIPAKQNPAGSDEPTVNWFTRQPRWLISIGAFVLGSIFQPVLAEVGQAAVSLVKHRAPASLEMKVVPQKDPLLLELEVFNRGDKATHVDKVAFSWWNPVGTRVVADLAFGVRGLLGIYDITSEDVWLKDVIDGDGKVFEALLTGSETRYVWSRDERYGWDDRCHPESDTGEIGGKQFKRIHFRLKKPLDFRCLPCAEGLVRRENVMPLGGPLGRVILPAKWFTHELVVVSVYYGETLKSSEMVSSLGVIRIPAEVQD